MKMILHPLLVLGWKVILVNVSNKEAFINDDTVLNQNEQQPNGKQSKVSYTKLASNRLV